MILDAGRVILDAGSLVAMVVKEVAVISAPLFGGLMAIVQLVSVTAGVTQKWYICALCCCKEKYKCILPMHAGTLKCILLATVLTKTGIILKVF